MQSKYKNIKYSVLVDKKEIFIDKNSKIDGLVSLGYIPNRKIESLKLIIGKNAIIRSGTVIYAGSKIGDNFETGHNVIIREECNIGGNFKIWNNSCVDYGCIIGNNVKIHNNVYIAQYTTIEDNVFIAPGVMIANDLYPPLKINMKGPTIEENVKIGINATILPHVIIGKNSLIGAGAVVVENVPPNSVVVGNPGRVIKSIFEIRNRFDKNGRSVYK